MASLLLVEHPETGAQYAVPAAHFRKELEPAGWRALAYEDGAEYQPPAPKQSGDKADKAEGGA